MLMAKMSKPESGIRNISDTARWVAVYRARETERRDAVFRDAFARGLKIAVAIRKDGVMEKFVKERYASWDSGIGADIEAGRMNFNQLSKYMLEKGNPTPNSSGRVEMLENLLNEYI